MSEGPVSVGGWTLYLPGFKQIRCYKGPFMKVLRLEVARSRCWSLVAVYETYRSEGNVHYVRFVGLEKRLDLWRPVRLLLGRGYAVLALSMFGLNVFDLHLSRRWVQVELLFPLASFVWSPGGGARLRLFGKLRWPVKRGEPVWSWRFVLGSRGRRS